jgi:hypothetical protein
MVKLGADIGVWCDLPAGRRPLRADLLVITAVKFLFQRARASKAFAQSASVVGGELAAREVNFRNFAGHPIGVKD